MVSSRCTMTSNLFQQAGQAFKKFLPLFDRVLVERCAAETVTKGGIMLPEKSQGKVLQATVVAVGTGSKGKVRMQLVSEYACIQYFACYKFLARHSLSSPHLPQVS